MDPITPQPPAPVLTQELPKFRKEDIARFRSRVDDATIMSSLLKMDPDFKARHDRLQPALSQLDDYGRSRFPTNLINKHYLGKWELEPGDGMTDALLTPSTPAKPQGLLGKINQTGNQYFTNAQQAAEKFHANPSLNQFTDSFIQAGANIFRGAVAPVTVPVNEGFSALSQATGLDQVIASAVQTLGDTPAGKAISQLYEYAKQNAPEQLKTLEDTAGAYSDAATVYSAAKSAEAIGKGVAKGVQKAPELAKTAYQKVTGNGPGPTPAMQGKAADALRGEAAKFKTPEEFVKAVREGTVKVSDDLDDVPLSQITPAQRAEAARVQGLSAVDDVAPKSNQVTLQGGKTIPTPDGYVYHSTTPEALRGITESGLQPKGQGVYFTPSAEVSTAAASTRGGNSVLVRAPSSSITSAIPDARMPRGVPSFISTKGVGRELLEVSTDGGKTWQALAPQSAGMSDDVLRQLYTESRKPDMIQKLVQPKRTQKELQALYEKNPELVQQAQGGIVRSSSGPLPTPQERALARELRRLAPELDDVTSHVDAGPVILRKISEKGAVLDDALQKNPFAIPRKESVAAVTRKIADAADDFGESPGVFQSELRRFQKFRSQYPGTGYGERHALIDYDAEVLERFGSSIHDKATARAQAIRAVREASQEVLEKAAQRAGMSYLPEIHDMHQLYRAHENVTTHITPDVFNSTLKNAAKSPVGKAAVEAAGITAGVRLLP